MRPELQLAFDAAKNLQAGELIPFLVELREIELEAMTRLCRPPATTATPTTSDDDILAVSETAQYIGMSPKWVYQNPEALPPSIRIGNGAKPRIHYRRGDLRIWREQHKTPYKRYRRRTP